jgi:hypothetical protein
MNQIPGATELTKEALDVLGIDGYDEGARYHNPLKNAKDGKHYNWDSASSGFVPKDTVNYILTFDSIAEGIANVAEFAQEEFDAWTDGNPVSIREIVGIVEELCIRFGRGAAAERHAKEILESNGSDVKKPVEGDENKKIDIRTDEAIHQVKLNDKYRSDWKEPRNNLESDENRNKNILWVKPDGEVLTRANPDARGSKKYEPI